MLAYDPILDVVRAVGGKDNSTDVAVANIVYQDCSLSA